MDAEDADAFVMIRRFARDWLFVAPMAVSISVLVSRWFDSDLVTEQLRQGALVTYGLSLYLASYDDLPIAEWERSGIALKTLATATAMLTWVLVALGLISLTASMTVESFNPSVFDEVDSRELFDFVSMLGWVIASVALVVGVTALVARISRQGRG